MVDVTPKAVDVLAEILERANPGPSEALRLASSGGGNLGLVLDKPKAEDQVVQQQDRTILVLDQDTAAALDGRTLDAVETPEGPQLTLSDNS